MEAEERAKAEEQRRKRAEYSRRYREKQKQLKQELQQAEAVKVETPFPADSIIAAAVAQKHRLTTIEAEGHSGNKYVIVENLCVEGTRYFRTKTVVYSYYRSKKAAIDYARTQGVKLRCYSGTVQGLEKNQKGG